MPCHMLPVIHAGAFELRVVELETKGFDEMQSRTRRGTEPGDVAGVRRDFGFDQNNMHKSLTTKTQRREAGRYSVQLCAFAPALFIKYFPQHQSMRWRCHPGYAAVS